MLHPGSNQNGFSLLETLIGLALFMLIAGSLYATYVQLIKLTKLSRTRVAATAVANQYLEIVRNLPYSDVGVSGSIPSGVLPQTQATSRDNINFNVRYTVRNTDDPFDGTLGGNPNDTSPADYKQATIEVTCTSCTNPSVVATAATTVTPKNLETSSTNGALFVQVLNANGQPVAGAAVNITNPTLVPPIAINDTTNVNGLLQIVDAPPATESYRIVVTKSGYTTDRTYAPDDPVVINPQNTDATILIQQVTQVTFIIDLLSQINIASRGSLCGAIANVPLNLSGTKLISTNPDVLKYAQDLTTDSNGSLSVGSMEWDSYNATLTGSSFDLRGTIPLLPFNLGPGATQDLTLIVQSRTSHSLLVTVRDAGTQLPLSGANVRLYKSGYDSTLLTSRGYLRQTDWSGGSGQVNLTNDTMYLSDDDGIDTNNPSGELRLKKNGNDYASYGVLTSSTFDTGTVTNFATIEWQPGDQPPQAGINPLQFQIATNNDNATWNFIGPDDTSGTYYTTSGQTVASANNGNRYLRYKVFLATSDSAYTPNLAELAVTFVSSCIPPGQAFFTDLASGTYNLDLSIDGYNTLSTTADLTPAWSAKDISLIPL